jgi:hypothetical protein
MEQGLEDDYAGSRAVVLSSTSFSPSPLPSSFNTYCSHHFASYHTYSIKLCNSIHGRHASHKVMMLSLKQSRQPPFTHFNSSSPQRVTFGNGTRNTCDLVDISSASFTFSQIVWGYLLERHDMWLILPVSGFILSHFRCEILRAGVRPIEVINWSRRSIFRCAYLPLSM